MTSKPFPETKPTAWDAFVMAAVLALAVIAALLSYGSRGNTNDLTVVVTVGNESVEQIRLADFPQMPQTYTHNGYTLTVSAEDDGICVEESNCPTQDCVHTGTITRAGQSIVCLPAQIVIHLEGTAPSVPDVIVG